MAMVARDKSFNRVAREYDEARPGYPDAVYDRILAFGSLRPETKVLEVGLGTGKATLPLAQRGFEILGIEPGTELCAIARSNLAPFPRVTIATTTFEAWTIERGSFGLAFSAQAFHWLDPELRLDRLAEALAAGGVLALFGNVPRVPAGLLRDDLDAAYQAFAPSLSSARDAERWYGTADSPVMAELTASRHFREVEFNTFDWQRSLDAPSYCRLLSSHSDHSTLPPAQLAALLARVAEVVHAHGGITLSYTTGLFLARRSTDTMSSLTEQLRNLEQRLACRQVQSRDELLGLLAERFREHGASGRAYSRSDVLDSYEIGRPTDVELFDFGITMLGPDAALATYRSEEAGGRRARRASIWVRDGGQWRMVFHQGTTTTEDAEGSTEGR